MIIDCDECRMQATAACQDCVVTQVLHDLAGPLVLDADEAEALETLADVGLVAPLRLVPRGSGEAAVAG